MLGSYHIFRRRGRDRGFQKLFQIEAGARSCLSPAATLFVMDELHRYRYEIESAGAAAPQGCPGEGQPADRHPTLPLPEIWKLPVKPEWHGRPWYSL
jgi:hypothetical protein